MTRPNYDLSNFLVGTSAEGFALKRWAAVSMFGFCVTGPIGSVWYPFLERFVRTRFPHFEPGSWRFIGTKFTMEQVRLLTLPSSNDDLKI